MKILVSLLLAIGLGPLATGLFRLRPARPGTWTPPDIGSVLSCALAFNLTFFWQELWLVIPKALTPGLHPVLYHNDHEWTGQARIVELLQGTGALATLFAGVGSATALVLMRGLTPTWRCFVFWMAFQGLFQSLTQLALGTMLPGNDVGRALTYLHVAPLAHLVLLVASVAAMAATGAFLARVGPSTSDWDVSGPTRLYAVEMIMTALLVTALSIPFRMPRDVVEVVLAPLFVNIVGIGWLTVGVTIIPCTTGRTGRSRVAGPAIGLAVTLLVFQLILRRGISL